MFGDVYKKLALGVGVFSALALSSPAYAQKGIVYTTSSVDWVVQKVGQDSGAAKPYCVMTTQFQRGATMSMAQNLDQEISLGLEFGSFNLAELGNRFDVVLDPGAGVQVLREGVISRGSTLVVRLGSEERFFQALRKTGYLRVEIANRNFGFNLSNIDAAKLRLDNCVYSIPRSVRVAEAPQENEQTEILEQKLEVMQKQIEQLTNLTTRLASENERLASRQEEPSVSIHTPVIPAVKSSTISSTPPRVAVQSDPEMRRASDAPPPKYAAQALEEKEKIDLSKKVSTLGDREAISELDIETDSDVKDVAAADLVGVNGAVEPAQKEFQVVRTEPEGLLPLPGEQKKDVRINKANETVDLYALGRTKKPVAKPQKTSVSEKIFEGELQSDEFSPYATARLVAEKEMAEREGRVVKEPVLKDETFFDNLLKEFEELEAELDDGQAAQGNTQDNTRVSKAAPAVLYEAQRLEQKEQRTLEPVAVMPKQTASVVADKAVELVPPPKKEPSAASAEPISKTSMPEREIRSGAVNAVFVPGYSIQSVLESADVVEPEAVQIVRQASGPDALVQQWRLRDVYGSSEQRLVSGEDEFENMVEEYLTRTEERCPGDYAVVADNSVNRGNTRVDSYEIACIGSETSSSASLLFIQKDNTFTALAHEAAVDDMSVAMALRDRVSKAVLQ